MIKILLFLLCHLNIYAMTSNSDSMTLSMVPRGKIVEKDGRKYKIKTPPGTRISIELFRNGKLDEASGKNLNKGDAFEPGQGLVSLSTAAQAADIPGTNLNGKWTLDHDEKFGWIYEFEGEHKGIDHEIVVSAKSGKVILNQEEVETR